MLKGHIGEIISGRPVDLYLIGGTRGAERCWDTQFVCMSKKITLR